MKIFFTILLILNVSISQAQSIQGSYKEKRVTEETHTITFDKGNFKEQFIGDLRTKLGFGSYSFKNGNLILSYKQYPKQDSSNYEFIDVKTSPNSNIELEIFDLDSIPMLGYYGCRDTKNEVLNIVSTDKKGKGNIIIFNNKNVGYLTIDFIGYHRISIPIKRLMGKSLTIKAYLKPQINYYIEPRTEIYKISKFSGKQLILTQKDITYLFEKFN